MGFGKKGLGKNETRTVKDLAKLKSIRYNKPTERAGVAQW